MRLKITHHTRYRYAGPVTNNANELRVVPIRSPWQRLVQNLIRIMPVARLRTFVDFHRNTVSYFEVEEPHTSLLIDVQSVVETRDRYGEGEPLDVSLDTLKLEAEQEALEPFLKPHGMVQIPPELWREAVDLRADAAGVFEFARAVMFHLHSTCEYVPGVTTVSTDSVEFQQGRRGVCQDFAHLMLALCRAVQLPARYVSGYLYDAKRGEVRGAHATHAWCEVWVPGRGWFGMDPTNHCLVDERYVVVAVGRDYQDVAPVHGTFRGGGERTMEVMVHLERG